MSNATPLMEPEPRDKKRGEETTRAFWKPALPEAQGPRPAAPARAGSRPQPYLLAPPPWPKGQFCVDPEA